VKRENKTPFNKSARILSRRILKNTYSKNIIFGAKTRKLQKCLWEEKIKNVQNKWRGNSEKIEITRWREVIFWKKRMVGK